MGLTLISQEESSNLFSTTDGDRGETSLSLLASFLKTLNLVGVDGILELLGDESGSLFSETFLFFGLI